MASSQRTAVHALDVSGGTWQFGPDKTFVGKWKGGEKPLGRPKRSDDSTSPSHAVARAIAPYGNEAYKDVPIQHAAMEGRSSKYAQVCM